MKIEIEGKEVQMRRVVAGLGWPSEKAGFLAVVGEELFYEQPFPRTGVEYRYHLIAEVEERDMAKLIHAATASKAHYGVEYFYGRLKAGKGRDLPATHYLEEHNRSSFATGLAPLHVTSAPFCDEDRGLLAFHLNILKSFLRPEKKSLFIPSTSLLNGYLHEIPDDVSNLKDVDYPAVAALAYAVSALTTWRQAREEDLEAERLVRELEGDY